MSNSINKFRLVPNEVFPSDFYARLSDAAQDMQKATSRDEISPIMAKAFNELEGFSDAVVEVIKDIEADYVAFRAGGEPKAVAQKIVRRLKGKEAQELGVAYMLSPTMGESLKILPKLVSALDFEDKVGVFAPMLATLAACGLTKSQIIEGMKQFGNGVSFVIEGEPEEGCSCDVRCQPPETRASSDDADIVIVVRPSKKKKGLGAKIGAGLSWLGSNIAGFFGDLIKNVFDWGLKGLGAGGTFGGIAGVYFAGPPGGVSGAFYGGLAGGIVSAQLAVAHTVLHHNSKVLSDISGYLSGGGVWLGPIDPDTGEHRDASNCDMPWVNC